MSFIDDRTSRNYPLPNRHNKLNVDVERIIAAIRYIDRDIDSLKQGIIKGAILDVTIPSTGWQELEPDSGIFFLDVEVKNCTGELVPILTLDLENQKFARDSGFMNICETREGVVRFFSRGVPAKQLSGKLTLMGMNSAIPTASLIDVGPGLVLEDGVLKLDLAADENIDALFDEENAR